MHPPFKANLVVLTPSHYTGLPHSQPHPSPNRKLAYKTLVARQQQPITHRACYNVVVLFYNISTWLCYLQSQMEHVTLIIATWLCYYTASLKSIRRDTLRVRSDDERHGQVFTDATTRTISRPSELLPHLILCYITSGSLSCCFSASSEYHNVGRPYYRDSLDGPTHAIHFQSLQTHKLSHFMQL